MGSVLPYSCEIAYYDDVEQAADLCRVRAISADRRQLYLESRNGQVASVSAEMPFDFEVGTVLLVRVADNHLEPAPASLWLEETWVGVVRLRLDDVTVVDSSGRLRLIPTNPQVEYMERNTVEVSDVSGIVRVLSRDPIRFLDLPAIDAGVIAEFRTDREATEPASYEDFGGLQSVVARAKELIELPLEHHDKLAQIGARPIKGVLFTGPPGTGKTMLARIIAARANAPFYEISGPEVFSKWYGESEELLRKLFADAARHKRAIIFFDEIDSVAAHRSDEAHEVSRRVVAQLLTLMDGFTSKQNVIVIATTNRPQDIDVALRRPGRFDWEVAFPLPGVADRIAIMETTARRINALGPLPHAFIAHRTNGWSGAELAAIWSEAALLAVADDRAVIVAEDYVGGYERVADQRRRTASGPSVESR
jgi:transitional endoplasmic reticulum ATPase